MNSATFSNMLPKVTCVTFGDTSNPNLWTDEEWAQFYKWANAQKTLPTYYQSAEWFAIVRERRECLKILLGSAKRMGDVRYIGFYQAHLDACGLDLARAKPEASTEPVTAQGRLW